MLQKMVKNGVKSEFSRNVEDNICNQGIFELQFEDNICNYGIFLVEDNANMLFGDNVCIMGIIRAKDNAICILQIIRVYL